MSKDDHIAEARAQIYLVDLNKIEHVLSQKGWRKSEIHAACKLYKDYLFLRLKHPNIAFPPSKDVNIVWKIHILYTNEYRKFCEKVFTKFPEKYLDYNFEKPNSVLKNEFENITQKLYQEEFGRRIEKIRHKSFWGKCKSYRKRIHLGWVAIASLASILLGGYGVVASHNNNVNSAYHKLKDHVRNLTYDEEDRYLLCSSNMKEKYPQLYIKNLYKTHREIRNDLALLVNLLLDMQENNILITPSASTEILHLTRLSATIYEKGMDMCEIKLTRIKEIMINREKLVRKIDESQKKFLW